MLNLVFRSLVYIIHGVIYISNISICLVRLAIIAKNEVEFIRLCGDGDLESVTQILANDPSLIKARIQEVSSKQMGKF